MVRRMATSVVGSVSCLKKNHRAGNSSPRTSPSSSTVMWAVIICFCVSVFWLSRS